MGDDATLEIMITAKNTSGGEMREAKDGINDMRAAVERLRAMEAAGIPVAIAVATITGVQAEAFQAEARAATQAAAATTTVAVAATAAWTAVLGGLPAWVLWGLAIGGVSAALSPFLVLIGSAVVIVTAFFVAGAGMVVLLAGLAAGFLALGAGILLLGGGGGVGAAAALDKTTVALQKAQEALVEFDQEHTKALTILQQHQREQLEENIAKAQDAYNAALLRSQGPIGVLLAQLGAMKEAWAAQATPMAALITQWVGGAIPAVQQLGSSLMTWFGERLPGALSGMSKLLQDLGPTFSQFASFLGKTFDAFFSLTSVDSAGRIVPFGKIVEQAIAGMVLAVQGLITNLAALSQWFMERLTPYGQITSQVFGFIGSAIQFVATLWGKFADWLVTQWPAITANANAAIKSISDGFDKWGPIVGPLITSILPLMGEQIKGISERMGYLAPLILWTGLALLTLATMLLLVINWIGMFVNWVKDSEIATRNFWTAVGNVIGILGLVASIPNPFTGLIGFINTAIGAARDLVWWLSQIHIPGAGATPPGYVPPRGGRSYAEGGTIPGPLGAPMLAVVHGGERVVPATGRGGSGGATILQTLNITLQGTPEALRQEIIRIIEQKNNELSQILGAT